MRLQNNPPTDFVVQINEIAQSENAPAVMCTRIVIFCLGHSVNHSFIPVVLNLSERYKTLTCPLTGDSNMQLENLIVEAT